VLTIGLLELLWSQSTEHQTHLLGIDFCMLRYSCAGHFRTRITRSNT